LQNFKKISYAKSRDEELETQIEILLDQGFLTFFLQFPLFSGPTLHFPAQHRSLAKSILTHEVFST